MLPNAIHHAQMDNLLPLAMIILVRLAFIHALLVLASMITAPLLVDVLMGTITIMIPLSVWPYALMDIMKILILGFVSFVMMAVLCVVGVP